MSLRLTVKVFTVAIFTAVISSIVCRAPARAATEFCPAQLSGPYTKSSDRDTTVHYYHLRALGPRTVEGTILADTDAGWFTWDQHVARTFNRIRSALAKWR